MWFQLFDLSVVKKLAKLDSSTESWVIIRLTEITTVENQNCCSTKLNRLDSSTNFLLNSGNVQNSDNRQEIEGVSFLLTKEKSKCVCVYILRYLTRNFGSIINCLNWTMDWGMMILNRGWRILTDDTWWKRDPDEDWGRHRGVPGDGWKDTGETCW